MFDHEPDVEDSERHRRNNEEVHGGDGVAVVAQEGHPALGSFRGSARVVA
jgi:hypothetical protein